MEVEEARNLLQLYADGLLEPTQARDLEAVLAKAPDLQAEYKTIKEENDLIAEALAPLHASRSGRIRVAEAMREVHRQAERVANTLPQGRWRIVRYGFVALSIILYYLLQHFYPVSPQNLDQTRLLTYLLTFPLSVALLVMGVCFVLGAEQFARAESWITMKLTRRYHERTRLEVLVMEVFGFTSIFAAGFIYIYMLDKMQPPPMPPSANSQGVPQMTIPQIPKAVEIPTLRPMPKMPENGFQLPEPAGPLKDRLPMQMKPPAKTPELPKMPGPPPSKSDAGTKPPQDKQ